MTQKALTFAFTLLATSLALASSAQAADPFPRIEAGCQKELQGDAANPKAVCSCVVRNFQANRALFNEDELDMLAASYEQDKQAEEELQGDKYSEIVLFDYDVGEGCLKNPKAFAYKK